MIIKIEYPPEKPADFQVYRVESVEMAHNIQQWRIDFSERMKLNGVMYDGEGNVGYGFDRCDGPVLQNETTVWFMPESKEEAEWLRAASSIGEMKKRTYELILVHRDVLIKTIGSWKTLYREPCID